MNITKFISQLNNLSYTQQNYLSSLNQFNFFLEEFNFSENDLKTSIFSYTKNIESSHFMRSIDISSDFSQPSENNPFQSVVNQTIKNNSAKYQNLIEKQQTHLGLESLNALRLSFNVIYPLNKLKKGQSQEDIERISKNVLNITTPFFKIMNKLENCGLPNVSTLAKQSMFGKNVICNYHEAIVLASIHNFAFFDKQNFINLINKSIPDNSLNNTVFLSSLANILYNQENLDLIDTIFKKMDHKLFTIACLEQTNNHSNFYLALKDFIKEPDIYFNAHPNISKEQITTYILRNLTQIGMLNNAYYVKHFTKQDKDLICNFFSNHVSQYEKNSLLSLVANQRFYNIDFEAIHNKDNITAPNVIHHILSKMHDPHIKNKGNISYLFELIAPVKHLDLVSIGNSLAGLNPSVLSSSVNLLTKNMPKDYVLQLMTSNNKIYQILEPVYRSKKLLNLIENEEKESEMKPSSRRNKI